MARIPNEEIERLKREVAVAELAGGRGIELERHGTNLLGLCPFHDDREPSLVITPEKNLWHCLGACQSGGSVIDWVMKAEGVSFRHAVELLRSEDRGARQEARVGVGPPAKHSTVRRLPAPVEMDVDDQAMSPRSTAARSLRSFAPAHRCTSTFPGRTRACGTSKH